MTFRALELFFLEWQSAHSCLVPGANVVVRQTVACILVSGALAKAGLERRGEIVRLVMTMRGGDRPKALTRNFQTIA